MDDADQDDDSLQTYQDAHRLAATVNGAATVVLGASAVVGVVQILYGMTYIVDPGPQFDVFIGAGIVVFGLLDVLAGYAVSIVLKGLAAIVRATADTAQSTAATARTIKAMAQKTPATTP